MLFHLAITIFSLSDWLFLLQVLSWTSLKSDHPIHSTNSTPDFFLPFCVLYYFHSTVITLNYLHLCSISLYSIVSPQFQSFSLFTQSVYHSVWCLLSTHINIERRNLSKLSIELKHFHILYILRFLSSMNFCEPRLFLIASCSHGLVG